MAVRNSQEVSKMESPDISYYNRSVSTIFWTRNKRLLHFTIWPSVGELLVIYIYI